jgi:hypothetical protein
MRAGDGCAQSRASLPTDLQWARRKTRVSQNICCWYRHSSRRGAVAARRAHNPKVAGSNPAAATNACVARAVVPPRPIPNRVVKRRSADATGA